MALASPQGAGALDIDVIASSNLGFGRIVATGFSGTVSILPSGTRAVAGGIALGNSFGASPASFTVLGDPNASYSVTLPLQTQLTAGPDMMRVDGFTSSPSGSGNLGATGRETVYLGATLHVGSAQRPGSYLGTFVVIVSYN